MGARLRPANQDGSAGCVQELARIIGPSRHHWPEVRLGVRGDAGFGRDDLMTGCERHDVGYVLGLARHPRLVARMERALRKSRVRHMQTGQPSRRFRAFRYRTRRTWSRTRRVVGKAESLAKGATPRFVVTHLGREVAGAQVLYEPLSCARGDMANRIKEGQLALFSDRTSTGTLRANQWRLYLASFADVLRHGLRRLGLAGSRGAKAQWGTIRVDRLKIAACVRLTARKVWVSWSSVYPYQAEFADVVAALRQAPGRAPPM